MITPATTTVYDQLKSLDTQILEAEAQLRILKRANLPGVLTVESNLAKSKAARKELMDAIEEEHNRS